MPKKTVITIHGGDSFVDYQQYVESLHQATVDPSIIYPSNWRKQLPELLGDEYEVIAPKMPCKENAKYQEWKIWFEKYTPYINENTHLVGHSLGAMFLARYCSENVLPDVASVHLVAGGYTPVDTHGNQIIGGGDFYTKAENLKNLESLRNCIVYHSEDDPIVAFECASFICKYAPSLEFNSFLGRGHFLQADFPELIDNL